MFTEGSSFLCDELVPLTNGVQVLCFRSSGSPALRDNLLTSIISFMWPVNSPFTLFDRVGSVGRLVGWVDLSSVSILDP